MRIRFRFSKLGRVRFTSQRDTARMWERALRRAEMPLAYTEGFSPRPRLSFGLALPTGCESSAEYVDVGLDGDRCGPEVLEHTLGDRLTGLLPEGVTVTAAGWTGGGAGAGSLQQLVTSCSWEMYFSGVSAEQLASLVDQMLQAPSIPIVRERKGREEHDDLRPSVVALAVGAARCPGDGSVGLVAELTTRPRGVRPVELVRGLVAASGGTVDGMSGVRARPGGSPAETLALVRACRTQQWIERDGLREEPLTQGTPSPVAFGAAHSCGRAS